MTASFAQFLVMSHRPWRRRLIELRLFVIGLVPALFRRFVGSPLWFLALVMLALTATSAYAFVALLIIHWLKSRVLAFLHKLGATRALDTAWRRLMPAPLRHRWQLFAKWRLGRRQVPREIARCTRGGRFAGRVAAAAGIMHRLRSNPRDIPMSEHDTDLPGERRSEAGGDEERGDRWGAGAPIVLGVDAGTSGVRVAALDARGEVLGTRASRFARSGDDPRDPTTWWNTLGRTLDALLGTLPRERVRGIAVDGTSGTLLAIDAAGTPLGVPLMYDDAVADAGILERVERHLPPASAAGGATSGLAKALVLLGRAPARVLHQADWIVGRLGGDFSTSDANNALKTGFDPLAHAWPDWIERAGMDVARLPTVHEPGASLGTLTRSVAERFGLSCEVRLLAGTTDGCASFLATGASRPGEAVTALGSTTVLKILSAKPLFAPEYGLYSHRIGDAWLAGGASNGGGRVLLQHFDTDALERLSARIDAERDSGLDYYPLPAPGERFPISDPALAPRLLPRPDDDAAFLHGLLEGLARIEALGYARLAEIGAPPLVSVRSVGGGAANPAWTRLRERALGVPFVAAASDQAAVGTARLALEGLHRVDALSA